MAELPMKGQENPPPADMIPFMQAALDLALQGARKGDGGPFGAVVVKEGKIIARGWNSVLASGDPTAHAEIIAIRAACRNLGTFQLADCDIYTSCEPCPMCLGAIYWSRPRKVYYVNTREEAASVGFDDRFIYEELARPPHERRIPLQKMPMKDALRAFEEWGKKTDKTGY